MAPGLLLLGAAGLLRGLRATTHWVAQDALPFFGADAVNERVVNDGMILTAGGVSAGIDLALTLVGRMSGPGTAQAIQLAIEYDPQPPFDAGTTCKASAGTIELARKLLTDAENRTLRGAMSPRA